MSPRAKRANIEKRAKKIRELKAEDFPEFDFESLPKWLQNHSKAFDEVVACCRAHNARGIELEEKAKQITTVEQTGEAKNANKIRQLKAEDMPAIDFESLPKWVQDDIKAFDEDVALCRAYNARGIEIAEKVEQLGTFDKPGIHN